MEYNQGNIQAAGTGRQYNFIGERSEIPTMKPIIGNVMGGEGVAKSMSMPGNNGKHMMGGSKRTQESIFNDLRSGKVAM